MNRQERVLVKKIHDTSAVLLGAHDHAETYLARIRFCDALEELRLWAESVSAGATSNQERGPDA